MKSKLSAFTPLAVVGASCRLPGAKDIDDFWRLVVAGQDATGELPDHILDRELYFDPEKGKRGRSYSYVGGLIPDLPFDNRKCRLPADEVDNYDPAHLTMCEVASEAISSAGYDPFGLPTSRVGVYVGHTGGSSKGGELMYAVGIEETAQYLREDPRFQSLPPHEQDAIIREIVDRTRDRYDHRRPHPNLTYASINGAELISKAFELEGPSVVVDAACASSLQALAMAARALALGSVEMAVVGGASCCKADSLILFSAAQSVSSGRSQPFDENASGLVTAEGYIALVLKRLPDAVAAGDQIWGVIRGLGMSADGKGKSLWAPLKDGQRIAVQRAYGDEFCPEQIQYMEAHATSTQVGDATELAALADTFPDELPDGRRIPLGSVKANIGHTLETAGLAGLLKILLAIRNETIPPCANLETPNPAIPWDSVPFYLPRVAEPWKRKSPEVPRLAAVNAFGIGGLNVHVVIEEYLAQASEPPGAAALPTQSSEPIAVVGMGAILPGATDIAAYLELLRSGRDPKTDATNDRWNTEISYQPGPPTPYRSYNRRGGFCTDYEYDWRRHRVPPKQIANANPLQFMLLDAADQALRQAGLGEKPMDADRVGVVVGARFEGDFSNQLQMGLRLPEFQRDLRDQLRRRGMPDATIEEICRDYEERLLGRMPALLDETGSFTSSTLASRITKTFNLRGGALALDAGPGTGLAALSAAVDSLRSGDCDVMVCAVGQRSMDLAPYEAFCRRGRMSPGEPQPAFDEATDGFVPGEGCGVLVLKRLSDARADGDEIVATLSDVRATSQWKQTASSLQSVVRSCVDAAGCSSESVRCVETIGTEKEREAEEVEQISTALSTRDRSAPLLFSSVADQFGYMGATHTMAAIIKACLAQSTGEIPVGIGPRNPRQSLFGQPNTAPLTRPEQLPDDGVTAIGVACGTRHGPSYFALIQPANVDTARRSSAKIASSVTTMPEIRTLRVGAGDWNSLRHRLASLDLATAAEVDSFSLADRARLAIVYRDATQLPALCQTVVNDFDQLRPEKREEWARRGVFFGQMAATQAYSAFLFPGQGSQYAGMLDRLSHQPAHAEPALRQVEAALQSLGQPPLSTFVGAQSKDLGSDIWKTQMAVLLGDWIHEQVLRSIGLRPVAVAGHSFGEYAALASAGAWSLVDAIRATRHRTDALSHAAHISGCMAATSVPAEELTGILATLDDQVFIANLNGPDQTVIAGEKPAVQNAVQHLKKHRRSAVLINVPCPFHTPLMQPALDRFQQLIPDVPIRDATIPVISTIGLGPMRTESQLRESLIRQLVQPVTFTECVQQLLAYHPALVVEAGPKQVLTRLARTIHPEQNVVFMAVDNPARREEALIDIAAQAECLGCLTLESGMTGKKKSEPRILEFDATERRRQRLRQSSAGGNQPVKATGATMETLAASSVATPDAPVVQQASSIPAVSAESEQISTGDGNGAAAHRLPAQPINASLAMEVQSPAMAEQAEVIEAARPNAISPNELQLILVEFVVEQTGYPEDIIEMDADLEADLGIDSIKKAQLFGEVGARFQIAPRDDLSLDDFPTLNHVQQFLLTELGAAEVPVSTPAIAQPEQPAAQPPASQPDNDETIQIGGREYLTIEEPLSTAAPIEATPIATDLAQAATPVTAELIPAETGQVAGPDEGELRQILIGFVIEQTGYPEDIIEMDADLEADLGIDSIKKAQLFGEVGSSFQIAPRDDLSLDDFPTLRHVLTFLLEELASQNSTPTTIDAQSYSQPAIDVDPQSTQQPQAALPVEVAAQPLTEAKRFEEPGSNGRHGSSGETNNDVVFPVVELTGDADQIADQYGRKCAKEIRYELYGMVDRWSPPAGPTGSDRQAWTATQRRQLSTIARHVGVNEESLLAWNARHLANNPTLAFAPRNKNGSHSERDRSQWVVQVRRNAGQLSHVVIALAGQLQIPFGINSAGLAVSSTAQSENPSDTGVVIEHLQQVLATCRSVDEAATKLESVNPLTPWIVGLSDGRQWRFVKLSAAPPSSIGADAATESQREFHSACQMTPCELSLFDRVSGESRVLDVESVLPIQRLAAEPSAALGTGTDGSPSTSRAVEPLPKTLQMQRHVLRMAPSDDPLTPRADLGNRRVLVIGDGEVAVALTQQLQQQGLVVDRADSTESVDSLVRRLDALGPQHLVLLDDGLANPQSLDHCTPASTYQPIFQLCQAWIGNLESAGLTDGATLIGMTRMGGDFGFSSGASEFMGGGVTGLWKGIRREFPALRTHAVDFSREESPATIAAALARELSSQPTECEVGYREGRRYVVQAIAQPVDHDDASAKLSGVWVVTGGARGVTAVVARELGIRHGLKLHLLGTAPLPDPHAEWRGLNEEQLKGLKRTVAMRARDTGQSPVDAWRAIEKSMELDRNLTLLREAGVDATYHVCDVSDRIALERTLQIVRGQHGPIDGVIHGAGVEAACRLSRKQPQWVNATIASKCDAASHLIALTRQDPLRFFVGFGSTSGRFGGLGQADYSLASDLLAKMMGRLAAERRDCRAVCFHWPAWDEVGMAARPESRMALEQGGLSFMKPLEGVAHVIGELSSSSREHEILILDHPGVLDTDNTMNRPGSPIDPVPFQSPQDVHASLNGKVAAQVAPPATVPQPHGNPLLGVAQPSGAAGEYLVPVRLDPTTDPFLIHHQFRGNPFCPAVVMLELFAQAAAQLRPHETFRGFSAARFESGLSIPSAAIFDGNIKLKQTANGIECALIGPLMSPNGRLLQPEHLYSTATVEFGSGEPGPIDPGTPVFGWTKFMYPPQGQIVHGPPIQTFTDLDFQHGGGRAKINAGSDQQLLGPRMTNDPITSPAALDGCMVASGFYGFAMLEQSIGLPRGLERFVQSRRVRDHENCVARFFYRATNDIGHVFDFSLVGEDGQTVIQVDGYQMACIQETA